MAMVAGSAGHASPSPGALVMSHRVPDTVVVLSENDTGVELLAVDDLDHPTTSHAAPTTQPHPGACHGSSPTTSLAIIGCMLLCCALTVVNHATREI